MSGYNLGNGIPTWNGIPMVGGVAFTTGKSFFVDAVTGSDGNKGTSPKKPFATINKAVASCSADTGDIIYCMPGHYEDLGDTTTTGAIDLNIAGISLIGLGNGKNQPRIDFNHADSDFLVSADNILIQSMNFEATVTSVKLGVSIVAGSDNTTIKDCRFTAETAGTDEFLISVNSGVVSNTRVINCIIDMGIAGAATGVKFVGANTGGSVRDCTIVGDYSQACIAGITTLSTDIYIENNLLVNGTGGNLGAVEVIEMLTGTTGVVRGNTIFSDVATFLLQTVADTMLFSANYRSDDTGPAVTTALTSASVVASADA